MPSYLVPGVSREDVFRQPTAKLLTGVPAFLGYTLPVGVVNVPQRLTLWQQFVTYFGAPLANGYLGAAVRGFFENGGQQCIVVPLDSTLSVMDALHSGLDAIAVLDTVDLVCAPDIMRTPIDTDIVRQLQQRLIDHCDSLSDRMAILDSLPGGDSNAILEQRMDLQGANAAIYFPWLGIQSDEDDDAVRFVPPSGHVAGIYARSDARIGVHKAPANEELMGIVDIEINLTNAQQGLLNPEGINAIRAFSGRGVRVWGARTINREPAWIYVNVRRLFLTVGRWIEQNLASTVYEPNNPKLWARITRELTAYFTSLFQLGSLQGNAPQAAFFVKCDSETNPPEVRDVGQVITDIGLAPVIPGEFIIVRIIHGASGVSITNPIA
jgi:phage tail sheath protein FI